MNAQLPGIGPIDTVVSDIDGVLLLGSQSIPGAGQALTRLQSAGLQIVFATNNSTRTPQVFADRLRQIVGFDPAPGSVVNSGAATASYIADKAECVFVLGSDGLRETLVQGGIRLTDDWSEADAVVTGLDPEVSYDRLASAGLAVQNGATFYATNDDAALPLPDGLYPGSGAISAVVERTTGVAPIVCGKPHSAMRGLLADIGGAHPLVIGDRPDTDLALGKVEGWATVLVLTGVIKDPATVPADLVPDVVLPSIADLPDALGLA